MIDVCNAVVQDGKMSVDWSKNWLVTSTNMKRMHCMKWILCRGIKLLEHAIQNTGKSH